MGYGRYGEGVGVRQAGKGGAGVGAGGGGGGGACTSIGKFRRAIILGTRIAYSAARSPAQATAYRNDQRLPEVRRAAPGNAY